MIQVFSGLNRYALQAELRTRIDAFVQEHGDFAYEQLDGEEASLDRIGEALTSLPFLAANKLVVLRQPGANKQFQEACEKLLGEVPEITDVVIVEPKLDKRSSYYKFLKKLPGFKELPELDERGLARWAVHYVNQNQASISTRDADYLVQRIGVNQQRMASELDKLMLVSKSIDKQTIDDLTEPTPQSKIFDLLDAAFAGQAKHALELYEDQRAQKVEPQEILAMLGWQLRQVALAKTAGDKHDLVREAKMSPYSANKAKRIAARLTLARLKELIATLTELDARSKRVPINLDQALRTYILQLGTD